MREREKRRRSYQITVIALMGIIIALLLALIFIFANSTGDNQPVSGSSMSEATSSSSIPAPPPESSSSSEPESESSKPIPPPVETSSSVAPPPPPPPPSKPYVPPVAPPPPPPPPVVKPTNMVVNQTGLYEDSETYENITISSNNVTLKNKTVTGDLYITSEVGKKGTIHLDNVIVEGELYIYNGADVDGIILNDCSINKMTVQNTTNTIGVIAEGKTEVGVVSLRSHAYFDESDVHYKYFGFRKIVTFEGPQVWYLVDFGNIHLDELVINSPLKLHTHSDTYISEVLANNSFKVTGKGTIDELRVKADNITYETKPKSIRNPSGMYNDPVYESR